VALVILTLTMTGLVKGIGDGARNQSVIEEKTYAQWVALNQIAKMQLEVSAITVGGSNGSESMAGRDWQWEQEIGKTSDPSVFRITVTTRGEGQSTDQAQAVGYLWNKHE